MSILLLDGNFYCLEGQFNSLEGKNYPLEGKFDSLEAIFDSPISKATILFWGLAGLDFLFIHARDILGICSKL